MFIFLPNLALAVELNKVVQYQFVFHLCVEPLLNEIEEYVKIKAFLARKTVASAHDVTCCIKNKSLQTVFNVISDFCDQTSVETNIDKSVFVSIRNLNGYNSVKETKILGISFNLDDPQN